MALGIWRIEGRERLLNWGIFDTKATDVDVRFAAPGAPGRIRLWSGMVLANSPWKMLPAFKGAIAAAFATRDRSGTTKRGPSVKRSYDRPKGEKASPAPRQASRA